MITALLMAAAVAAPASCLPAPVVARLNELVRTDRGIADYTGRQAADIQRRTKALRAAKVAPDESDSSLAESYARDVSKYRQEADDVEAVLRLAPKCGH